MFYGADGIRTIHAELDAGHGYVMSGAFTSTRSLALIDLTKIPDMPSVFDHGQAERAEEIAFLKWFADDVARPIHDRERVHVDYIPTQVVTEYLRDQLKIRPAKECEAGIEAGIDGIVYRSSRCNGTCYVIFANHRQCLSSMPVVKSLRGPRVAGIREPFRLIPDGKPQLLEWAGRPVDVRRTVPL